MRTDDLQLHNMIDIGHVECVMVHAQKNTLKFQLVITKTLVKAA